VKPVAVKTPVNHLILQIVVFIFQVGGCDEFQPHLQHKAISCPVPLDPGLKIDDDTKGLNKSAIWLKPIFSTTYYTYLAPPPRLKSRGNSYRGSSVETIQNHEIQHLQTPLHCDSDRLRIPQINQAAENMILSKVFLLPFSEIL